MKPSLILLNKGVIHIEFKDQDERMIEFNEFLGRNLGRALTEKEVNLLYWFAGMDIYSHEILMGLFEDLAKNKVGENNA